VASTINTNPPAPGNDPTEGLITGEHTYETITDKVASIVINQRKQPLTWYVIFGGAFIMLNVMMATIVHLLFKGIGIWGINIPSGWGWDIINFVWWIGIGHAGTLISAILLLLRQQWRTSINRFAEAMTLFAVACAGLYPLLHTGRPWVAYWLFPYPNVLGMWPQFRSPLVWDVFAVSTYATVSAMFWFVGLIPDLATMRDRATNPLAKIIFGCLSLGWRGSAQHWQRYEAAYLMLAGLSTPLVLSVHSIVSFDFSVGIVPGWHTTIFPPYFVAGAVYAGFAMVILLAIPTRAIYGLKDFITMKHLDWMAKIMLTTGLIVFYGYLVEVFYAWYGGDKAEMEMMHNRMFGPYGWSYWMLITCNGFAPQLLWFPRVRRSIPMLFILSLVVSLGMWLERFVIVTVSLTRTAIPATWGYYTPTVFDWSMFLGTMGQFLFLFFLFIRFVPMIAIFEMRDLLHKSHHDDTNGNGHGVNGHTEAAPIGTQTTIPAGAGE